MNVRVNAHELPACPVPERSAADTAPFRLTLTALGPFEASDLDVEREIPLHEAGHPLAFNPETLGVDAVATDDELTYIGHSERRSEGSIDVLLWPEARACSLTAVESSYPGPNAGQALGFAERLGLLLIAGENVEDQRAGSALVLDTQTGVVSPVLREHGALKAARAFATVTPFADGLLVAGGADPFPEGASVIDPAGSAELYLPSRPGFASTLVGLRFRRAHHAAVELPATGETLLVGGVVPNPNGGPGQEILQLEAVSPSQGASITNLGRLGLGRVDPQALVLTNGRIFVGGGYLPGVEESPPTPVGQVEWFAPHAGPEDHAYTDLPARPHRTFVSLPGGGVLTVASCNEPSRRDCACVTDAGTACDERESDGWLDAFWIPADLTPRPVGFARGNVAACPTPKQPLLVPGSDGSPWLVSSDGDGAACLWRFEAWPEEPDAASDEPTARPRFVPTTRSLDPAPDQASLLLSFGPDALVWTSTKGAGGLFGARLGHRGPLTRDSGSLLDFDGQRPFRPSHLAPDRDPSDVPAGSPLRLRYEPGAVTLRAGESPLTLFVTDTLYDDVRVRLVVDALDDGAPPERPLVVFASRIGATNTCSWAQSALAAAPIELLAERVGRQVFLTVSGTDERVTCDAPIGPVAIGVRAGGAPTRLTSLRVERL